MKGNSLKIKWRAQVFFCNNRIGRQVSSNGDIYIGNHKDNEINGYGEYNYASGNMYKGFWIDQLMHGFGTLIDADGLLYEGQFIKNKKQDKKGKLELTDGTIFIGEYRDDKRNGHG